MLRIIVCLSVAALIFSGCRSKVPVYYGDAEVIEIPKTVTESIFDVVDNYRYIPLNVGGNLAAAIGGIDKVRVFRDKIYVMDNITTHKLLIFDKDGTFLKNVGRKGRGPQEYVELTTFEIDYHREEILIRDNTSEKVLVFGLDGEYKRTLDCSIWGGGIAVLPNGNIVRGIEGFRTNDKKFGNYKLIILDSDNNILERHCATEVRFPSLSQTFLNPGFDGTVTFAPQMMNEVYRISEGGVEHIYIINFTDMLDIKEIPDLNNPDNLMDFFQSPLAQKMRFVGNHADSEDYFCFTYEHNSRRYTVYYDKKTGLSTVSDDRLCGQNLTFDEEGNVWGSIMETSLFFANAECEKVAELREAIQKSGNPILVTYTLK
ncbi:MAG: 6-bladed beta-propeller [Rikenellaceae bacterium]|nr:6-bladed beta-propeller [Rikenellaceae bacterium]MCL2691941.1 6-bladed beta-propeller [Rikenellaceae bacterium]